MNNTERIKALRYCANENNVCTEIENCGYYGNGFFCSDTMMRAAADALETAEKRIEELEAKIPKEGEWIVDKKGYPQIICSLCDVHIPMVAGWCMDAHINYCPNCGARMKGEEK